MTPKEPVRLTRDCEVVQIPEGLRVRIARGTEVRVMQSLGGTYTVMTEYGTMVRIDPKDADAIGEKVVEQAAATDQAETALTAEQIQERVWHALRSVFDPEIPVNVVELGLVYKNEVTPLPEGGFKVFVQMTLTAPGCGMGPVLQQDALWKIKRVPGAKDVNVEIVVEPPWNQTMMSDAAKLELGLA